ncbi:hypothetical protein TWF718_009713 [Orbilia javanica]|uniref:MADS-box domain-containing protein n=1 Tax=Orbilia javanica TaxID=47235 RepID=A0AAN8REY0_9PEZI
MGTDFRFKRSKTSFLCKANKLRENYNAEVYVVIKRNQKYAIYASGSGSRWPPSLDTIKNSNANNEVWCPENIHLLEPKKKNDPDDNVEVQMLESPPPWSSENVSHIANRFWDAGKNRNPSLNAASHSDDELGTGSRLNARETRQAQRSPAAHRGKAPTEPQDRKFFHTDDGENLFMPDQERNPYFQGWGDDYESLSEDPSPKEQKFQTPMLTRADYDNGQGFVQGPSDSRSQIAGRGSSDLMQYQAGTESASSSSLKSPVAPKCLRERDVEPPQQSNELVLSSLHIEPPRFKGDRIQRHKRRRGIYS